MVMVLRQALATLAKRTKQTSSAGFAIIIYVDLYCVYATVKNHSD